MKFTLFQQLRKLYRVGKTWPTLGKKQVLGNELKRKIFEITRKNSNLKGSELHQAINQLISAEKSIKKLKMNQYAKEVKKKINQKKKN